MQGSTAHCTRLYAVRAERGRGSRRSRQRPQRPANQSHRCRGADRPPPRRRELRVGLRDSDDTPNSLDELCDWSARQQRLPRPRYSSMACRAQLVMGIELHQASEASPFAVRWWFDSGVDRAVRTGGLGRADHKCVHLRMSCRLHRRLPGRSTGHERTVPWIRTPSRRLLQPIEEPTDIPHPSPFPMQSRMRRIPPAATSRIQKSALFFKQ